MVRSTPAGREALAIVHHEAEELVSEVLLRMTEEDTASLLVGLRAFLSVLHAHADHGMPPALPEHDHDFPTEVAP